MWNYRCLFFCSGCTGYGGCRIGGRSSSCICQTVATNIFPENACAVETVSKVLNGQDHARESLGSKAKRQWLPASWRSSWIPDIYHIGSRNTNGLIDGEKVEGQSFSKDRTCGFPTVFNQSLVTSWLQFCPAYTAWYTALGVFHGFHSGTYL